MKKIVYLNEKTRKRNIKSSHLFSTIKIIRGTELLGETEPDVSPIIDFNLMGPRTKFQFSAMRLKDSKEFTCFNLLDVAREYIDDEYIAFDGLTISCNSGYYKDKYSINLEIEWSN